MDLPYQTVKYELTGADAFKAMKVGGNDLLLVKPSGDKPFQLTTRVTSRVYSFKEQMAKYSEAAGIPDEVKPYLGRSEGVDPQSPGVVEVASTLRSDNKMTSVRNIIGWIEKNIRYQVVRPKSAASVIQNWVGECSGKAKVFIALCRACGIPAREVWGMAHVSDSIATNDFPGLREYLRQNAQDPTLADDPNTLSTHTEAEFYLPGAGWILVDPGNPKSLGRTDNRYVRVCHDFPRGDRSVPYDIGANMGAMLGSLVRFKPVE
jgi:transglutaminase-like putative cysteine protease